MTNMTSVSTLILLREWADFLGVETDDYRAMRQPLGDGVFPSAQEYIDAGLTPSVYEEWYKVGGWSISGMIEILYWLKEGSRSLEIDWLGQKVFNHSRGYESSLAWQYCNGDIDLDDLAVAYESI